MSGSGWWACHLPLQPDVPVNCLREMLDPDEIDAGRTADTVFVMKSRRLWLAVLAVLLIAFLGLVNARREIAQAMLIERARVLGLPGFSVDVTSLGVDRLTLANLRIDVGSDLPALEVAEIELRYSARSLLDQRFVQVDVRGLRLSARLRDGEIDFGLDDGSDRAGGTGSAISRPFDALNLEDAEMTLFTENDELRLVSEIRSRITPDAGVELEIDFDLEAANSELAARIRLRGGIDADGALQLGPIDCIAIELPASWFEPSFRLVPDQSLCLRGDPQSALSIGDPFENPSNLDLELTLDPIRLGGRIGEGKGATLFESEIPEVRIHYAAQSGSASPELRLSSAGGRLDLPDEALSIEELAFDLGVSLPTDREVFASLPTGTFVLGRILDRATPARFGPLTARGQLDADGEKLRLGVDLADIGRLLKLRIDAVHTPDANAGSLEFALEPLVLEDLGDRLSELLPELAGKISVPSGRLGLFGKSSWLADTLEIESTLELGDLGLTTPWGQLSGLESIVTLQGPAPFYMAETQRATIARFVAGVEISDFVVDFRLRRDGVVEFPLIRWSFAGGIAQTDGFYDPQSEQHEFIVSVTGVDLQTLLELLTIDGLSGKGTLAGEFPVYINGDVIELREARLASTSKGGWLRYRPGAASAAAAIQNQSLNQFTQLLENFHFKSIVISLNGSVLGDVKTAIHLEGANPDFQDGLPAELNLNVESKLWDLVQEGTAGFRLADRLADVMGRSAVAEKH